MKQKVKNINIKRILIIKNKLDKEDYFFDSICLERNNTEDLKFKINEIILKPLNDVNQSKNR